MPFLFKVSWSQRAFDNSLMFCRQDIARILNYCNDSKAILAVKCNYKTKHAEKYLGNKNSDYPRKS